MKKQFVLPLILIGLGLTQVGCQKDEKTAPTFSTVYQTLSSACIQCHQPGGSSTVSNHTLIDFSSKALAYSTLMGNVNGDLTKALCPNVKIVAASSPGTSYLLGTINSVYNSANFAGVSGCQPYAGHFSLINLSAEQHNAIINWIQDGAKDN